MRNMTTSRVLWLVSARPAAVVASTATPAGTPVKLRRDEAVAALAPVSGVAGSAAFGAFAGRTGHSTPTHLPVYVNRPMGDEQIRAAARGGAAQGPHHAWREPVIP
ncbi:hypothetical protein GCM10023074_52310 [Microbispora amethystogenes]